MRRVFTMRWVKKIVLTVLAVMLGMVIFSMAVFKGSVQDVRLRCMRILNISEDSYHSELTKFDYEFPAISNSHVSAKIDDGIKNILQVKYNSSDKYAAYGPVYITDGEIRTIVKIANRKKLGKSKRDYSNMKTVGSILDWETKDNAPAMELFRHNIGQYDMYRENDKNEPNIIKELRNVKIKSSEQHERGTQFKLIFTFVNGEQALFKPKRFPRGVGTWANHFYFSDFERHFSEIASYHLDRLLGFRRAVPVSGRFINITEDVIDKTSENVENSIFVSPGNNLCMVGTCKYYCDTGHAVCGEPERLEGSFAAYLPSFDDFPIKRFHSPYRRSYSKRRQAKWETNPEYCEKKVKKNKKYNTGRLLLDLIDMHIFDFLTGNMDRHHMEFFSLIEPEPYLVHLDHGRGFGKAMHDDLTILAPLSQCCIIRMSTLKTLVSFYKGPALSKRMKEALKDDPVAPVLLEPHLEALDRRVKVILKSVQICLKERRNMDDVITDDGY